MHGVEGKRRKIAEPSRVRTHERKTNTRQKYREIRWLQCVYPHAYEGKGSVLNKHKEKRHRETQTDETDRERDRETDRQTKTER
jgi:hypothetical protein